MQSKRIPIGMAAALALASAGVAAMPETGAGFSAPRLLNPRPAPTPDPERQAAAEAKRQRKAAKRIAAARGAAA